MTLNNSLKAEILKLVLELESLGGSQPSDRLRSVLESDSDIVVKKPATRTKQTSPVTSDAAKVGARTSPKKDATKVTKTISEISTKLKQAFESDSSFEQGVRDLESSGLTKAHVAQVYKEVIGSSKTFPKSVTKEALLDALRKDRIMKIRAAS
jgi:hypothetical protein